MEDHQNYAMQIVSASVLPMALKASIELGVFDIIERAGTEASLSPFRNCFPISYLYHLKDAVLEGGVPFDRAHGINNGEYARNDERWGKLCKASFGDFNPLLMDRILETYDGFEGANSLVDVGGGDGSVLNMILSKHPKIKGINCDLAPVIEKGPTYPGIQHIVGDMFVSIPKGDVIFMKWVTHGIDDGRFLKVLRNAYEALPATGKVAIVDMVMPETPETDVAAKSLSQYYLFMTSVNPRAKERTGREFQCLAKEAGFSRVRVACRTYNYSVLEFIKCP